MEISEILEEFEIVYERSLKLTRSVSEETPTREDVLAVVHMIFARKDSEFDKSMAIEMSEKQRLDAVYGKGYSSDDYEG